MTTLCWGRTRLPNRRIKRGEELVIASANGDQRRVAVDIGFDADGCAREIFVDGLKDGSELRLLITHAAILGSLLLQLGQRPGQLLARIGLADPSAAAGQSILSRALALAERIEAEEGEALRRAHVVLAQEGVRS